MSRKGRLLCYKLMKKLWRKMKIGTLQNRIGRCLTVYVFWGNQDALRLERKGKDLSILLIYTEAVIDQLIN